MNVGSADETRPAIYNGLSGRLVSEKLISSAGIAEVFLAPWAIRHRAWDLIVIGVVFCVFDLWGTLRLTNMIG